LVFRTSWLYGDGLNNFLYKLEQWAAENKKLKIVNDEISIPTSTHIVAKTTLSAIQNNLKGLYHLTCTGYCSRYEWARVYFGVVNPDIIIYPCSSKEIFQMTPRPMFSALDNAKICEALQIELPHWDKELINYLTLIASIKANENPNFKRLRENVGVVNNEDIQPL
jgi:dTDP-4-dehydrorhamnose reductase